MFQRKHETTTYFISYMAPLHNTQDHMIFEQRVVQYSSKLRLLLAGDHCKPFRSNRSKESTSKIKGVKSLMLSVLLQIHFSKSANLEIYSSERYEVYIPPTSTSRQSFHLKIPYLITFEKIFHQGSITLHGT